jgi:hypothetical protein
MLLAVRLAYLLLPTGRLDNENTGLIILKRFVGSEDER